MEEKPYLETGFTCWTWVPHTIQVLGSDRVRLIHLTRHPLDTAYSWVSQLAYVPPMFPMLPEKVLLAPEDTGVAFPEYAERWPGMGPVEKALYYWLELHTSALNTVQDFKGPTLSLRFEELFSESQISTLLDFLDLPFDGTDRFSDDLLSRRDAFPKSVQQFQPPEVIRNHPKVLELAETFDYDVGR